MSNCMMANYMQMANCSHSNIVALSTREQQELIGTVRLIFVRRLYSTRGNFCEEIVHTRHLGIARSFLSSTVRWERLGTEHLT